MYLSINIDLKEVFSFTTDSIRIQIIYINIRKKTICGGLNFNKFKVEKLAKSRKRMEITAEIFGASTNGKTLTK